MPIAGILYLIPSTLGDACTIEAVLPPRIREVCMGLRHFIVENEKSARAFLKRLSLDIPIQEFNLTLLNEHTNLKKEDLSVLLQPLLNGFNMGILSDAGCPAIADPGADVVKLAHEKNIKVVPLVGPSSILLALMASGFNGQSFVFHGYLPRERPDRIRKLKELELDSARKKQTQLFIETPYRNQHMFEDILATCEKHTQLCLAVDITLQTEFIATKSLQDWKNQVPQLNKRPAIFLLHKY
jgi:16S rRNA (cytidine1402-2'-O)-methyltransferase